MKESTETISIAQVSQKAREKTRNDGSAFMRAYNAGQEAPVPAIAENVAQMRTKEEKGLTPDQRKPLDFLVAGAGFEPTTFGL
jgi:hypothetical protein